MIKQHSKQISPKPNNPQFKDIEGQKFGQLTVVSFWGNEKKRTFWNCICECGNEANKIRGGHLKQGLTVSCGCFFYKKVAESATRHGESLGGKPTPEFNAYFSARQRCRNPKSEMYSAYGGRGIEFRFDSIEDLLAEVGRKPSPKHSLDRINVNGHYEKGNIRWATAKEQANNTTKNHRLTVNGQTKTISKWADTTGTCSKRIYARLKYGWCESCAVLLGKYTRRCNHK